MGRRTDKGRRGVVKGEPLAKPVPRLFGSEAVETIENPYAKWLILGEQPARGHPAAHEARGGGGGADSARGSDAAADREVAGYVPERQLHEWERPEREWIATLDPDTWGKPPWDPDPGVVPGLEGVQD